ncbi:MAG: sterol desaturase family protein [Hyphomicrobiaceae bacterium]|nr:sterol desaturase family protein [Hyphomicrobiaceae bacterium]
MSWSTPVEIAEAIAGYLAAVVSRAFIAPTGAFAATSLLTAFLIATAFLLLRRRSGRAVRPAVLLRALLPRRWWRTASARADIGLAAFNIFLFGLLLGWAVLSGQAISRGLGAGLSTMLGAPEPVPLPEWLAMTVVTIALFLAYELGYWIDHYLAHRIPFLWEFHKVHHAAETLSPLTNARVHPVDTIVFYNITAIVMGLVGGLTYWLLGRKVPEITLLGINAIAFLFGYLTNHLQHSHMWIPFTGWLGRLLVSPAHHQIHHSTNPIHFDKNLGSSLAVFDWVFGTLHIPSRDRERLTFGIEPQAVSPHTVQGAMVQPFRNALATVLPADRTPTSRGTALPTSG